MVADLLCFLDLVKESTSVVSFYQCSSFLSSSSDDHTWMGAIAPEVACLLDLARSANDFFLLSKSHHPSRDKIAANGIRNN